MTSKATIVVEIKADRPYAGKTVLADAIFRFLSSQGIDNYILNAEGDLKYKQDSRPNTVKDEICVEIRDLNERPSEPSSKGRSIPTFHWAGVKRGSDSLFPPEIEALIKATGGTVEGHTRIDDHEAMTVKIPLPKDHWLLTPSSDEPPAPWKEGADDLARGMLVDDVVKAAKYAPRAATLNGKAKDIDPDAVIQNLVAGLLGNHSVVAREEPKQVEEPDMEMSDADRVTNLIEEVLEEMDATGKVFTPSADEIKSLLNPELSRFMPKGFIRFVTSEQTDLELALAVRNRLRKASYQAALLTTPENVRGPGEVHAIWMGQGLVILL